MKIIKWITLVGAIHSCSTGTQAEDLQQSQSRSTPCTLIPNENLEAAWQWAVSTTPAATGMIIYQNGELRLERYELANACPGRILAFLCRFGVVRWLLLEVFGRFAYGGSPTRPFSLFSMTKSIAGIAAVLLEEQGISLETPVSTYIPEWVNDSSKSTITVRDMLSLSSGIDATSRRVAAVTLAEGLNVPLLDGEPRYDYGAEPFTVFSQFLKTATGGQDPQAFLDEHLFGPLGISIPIARTNDDARIPVLSSGGMGTLQDLATLGLELLASANGNSQVFSQGEQAISKFATPGLNPAYGLGFWLNAEGLDVDGISALPPTYPQCGSDSVFHMIGAGGQVMTVAPDHGLVLVKSASLGETAVQQRQGMWDALFRDLQCQCV